MLWLGLPGVPTTVVASGNTILLVLSAAELLLRPFTIVRTRFELNYASDQIAASEVPFGVLGAGVFSQVAAGSVARMPDPATEPDYDWFVYQAVQDDFRNGATDTTMPSFGRKYTVDSKVMRKVGANDDVAFIHAQVAAVGADIQVLGRLLIKLH